MNLEENFLYDTINEDVKESNFQITWDLLRKCTYDCTYCPPHRHDTVSKFPEYEDLKNVADFLISYCNILTKYRKNKKIKICLTGGEPTIYPEFIKIIKYLRNKIKKNNLDCQITITTNGAFGKSMFNLVSNNLDFATISYHPEANSKQKQIVLNNILKFDSIYKKDKNKCRVSVNVMFHKDFFNECKQICETLNNNNIRFNARPIGDGGSMNAPYTHSYNKEQADYIVNYWRKDNDKKKNVSIKLDNTDDQKIYARNLGRSCCAQREITLTNSITESTKKTKWITRTKFAGWYCSINWFFLHINQHDNELLHHQTCKQLYNHKRGPITDLSKESLNKFIEWMKINFEYDTFPVLQCSKTVCSCGMCVPKSIVKEKLINILDNHLETNKLLR